MALAVFDKDRYCTPWVIAKKTFTFFDGLADLDPCWDPHALRLAKTQLDIRKGQDGLRFPWRGKVYLNPPYSDPEPWLRRAALLAKYGYGECIALVNVATATKYWARYVWPAASAIRFLEGRLDFLYEGRPIRGNRYEQAVLYYGPRVGRFWRIFGRHPNLSLTPHLTTRSRHDRMSAMVDSDTHATDIGTTLLTLVAPGLMVRAYQQVRKMTVEEVLDAIYPTALEFFAGYATAKDEAAELAGANGRDHAPHSHEAPRSKTAPARSGRKARTRPAAAAPKRPRPAAPKKATKPPRALVGSSKGPVADLDALVLDLLKGAGKGAFVKSRDMRKHVPATISDNQLRKSLGRLVDRGLAVAQGATKSKVYAVA